MAKPVAPRAKRKGSGSVPSSYERLRRVAAAAIEPLERRVMLSGNPPWLAPSSAATWNSSTQTLTVTGSATIIGDPGSDEPNIVASGSSAQLTVAPTTSPTDVHVAGITLNDGALLNVASVGTLRSNSNHNTLVVGTLGSASDPTLSIDSHSKLDLEDNDLIIHTGTSDSQGSAEYDQVYALAAEGRNPSSAAPGQPDGQWDGNGISSSAAHFAFETAGYETLGLAVVVNDTLLTGTLASWQVGTADETLGASDVIVKYDYLCDYTLAGTITSTDASILQSEDDGGTSTDHTWATGSSLYDGLCDSDEASLFQLQSQLTNAPTGLPAEPAVSSVVVNQNLPSLAGPQHSMVDSIVYTFNQAVSLDPASAFSIAVAAGQTGTLPTLNWSALNPDANGDSTQWVVTFSGNGVIGGSIADGVYTLSLNPTAAKSEAYPSLPFQPHQSDTFFRLFGDADGSGVVNETDSALMQSALSNYNPVFDYNADGVVNAVDNAAFQQRLNGGGFHGVLSVTPAAQSPTNVAVAAKSSASVIITWDAANAPSVTGYRIEYQTYPGSPWVTIAQNLSSTSTSFIYSSNLSADSAYRFAVAAEFSGATSDWSAPSNYVLTPPNSPQVTATVVSQSEIDLSWSGGDTSTTSIEVDRSTDGTDFVPIATDLPADTTLFQDTGLEAGTHYWYQIVAHTAGSASIPASVDASTLMVSEPAPTDLKATASDDPSSSSEGITLSWNSNSPDVQQFIIERSTDGVNFDQTPMTATGPGSYAWLDSQAVEGNEYWYQVLAVGPSGTSAPASISAWMPPAPVTNLAANAVSSSEIDLTWTNNSQNASGIEVQQSTDGINFSTVPLPADQEGYQATGLQPGTQYWFRVVTLTAGSSSYAGINLFTQDAAVSNVQATAVSPTQINLSWQNNSAEAWEFEIDQSTDGDDYTYLGTVTASGLGNYSYSALGLAEGTHYWFRVEAIGMGGASSPHGGDAWTLPLAPVALTATAVSATEIDLTWVNNSTHATGIEIEQSTDDETFTALPSLNQYDNEYQDTGLAPNTQYWYRVIATTAGGQSTAATASATTWSGIEPAPTNLVALPSSTGQIDLSWHNNSQDLSYFDIQISTDGSNYTDLTQTASTQFSATGLDAGTQYWFQVTAVGTEGTSASATVETSTLQQQPANTPPGDLTATAMPDGSIDLFWYWPTTPTANDAPVEIDRSLDGVTFQQVTTVSAGTVLYADTGLAAGTNYFYRVDLLADGSSESSNIASARTAPTGNDWVSVDTVVIPVTENPPGSNSNVGIPVNSNVTLEAGVNYQLVATGDFYLGGPSGRADAEYAYVGSTNESGGDYDGAFQYGVSIDDPTLDANKYPYWGSYNGSHVYTIDLVGAGQQVTFLLHDDDYNDNVQDQPDNPLQVQIFEHLPAAPTNLVATAEINGQVDLTWQNNATDQTGFDIQRSDDGGQTFQSIGSVNPDVTSYVDKFATAGEGYEYRVAAFNQDGDGEFSNTASTVPLSAATVSGHIYQTSLDGQEQSPLSGVTVYVDTNGNGVFDAGEPSAVSGADGSYTITVPVETYGNPQYTLALNLPTSTAETTTLPTTGSYNITVGEGAAISGEDFGVYLAQSPTFDSTPPHSVNINPYAPELPLTDWIYGDLYVPVVNDNGQQVPNETPGILTYNTDGSLALGSNGQPLPVVQYLVSHPSSSEPDNGHMGVIAWDQQGDLWAVDSVNNQIEEFGPNTQFVKFLNTGAAPLATPKMIVFDAYGDFYVSNAYFNYQTRNADGSPGIYKFNPQGQLIGEYMVNNTIEDIALAPDQHTLLVDGFDFQDNAQTLYTLDTNTGIVTPFATLPGNTQPAQMAYLPNGGVQLANGDQAMVLVADATAVLALNSSGQVVGEYTTTDPQDGASISDWYSISLDPNGTSFWTTNTIYGDTGVSTIAEFDIKSGRLLESFDNPNTAISGSIYGQLEAAVPPAGTPTIYQSNATDPNGNFIIYGLEGNTHGATISTANGVLTWNPTAPGAYTFTITAQDSRFPQLEATQTFTVTVTESGGSDQPPTITTPSQLSPAMAGIWYSAQIQASDPNGDRLTYSLINSPDFSIDPNTGGISWLPNAQDQANGSKSFTVEVTNPVGGTAEETFTIPVIEPAPTSPVSPTPPAPPTFNQAFVPPSATAGQTLDLQFQDNAVVYSGDHQTLRFTAVSLPSGMTLSPTSGEIIWTPGYNQVGVQQFTVGVSDGQGDYIQKTFTVTVNNNPSWISDFTVVPLSGTTEELTVVPSDPNVLDNATFTWGVAPSGLQAPTIESTSANGDSVIVQFYALGDYQIEVTGSTAEAQSATFVKNLTVDQVPGSIVLAPQSLWLSTGESATVSGTVYDQFGNPMATQPPLTWSLITNQTGGSIDPTSGSYQAGGTLGEDVIEASVPSVGSDVVTGIIGAVVVSPSTIAGTLTFGMSFMEGQSVDYDGLYGAGFVGTFYDPRDNPQASDYSATINWGDGTSSTGSDVSIAPDQDPSQPADLLSHLFTISATHAYKVIGTYSPTVQISGPNGSSATLSEPPGQGITITPAPMEGFAIDATPMVSDVFTGEVAEFVDSSPLSSPDQFEAVIDWGDGSPTSIGTLSQDPFVYGGYEISGSHVYTQDGDVLDGTVYLYETDAGPAILRASTRMKVTVIPATLMPPTGVTATAIADQAIEIQWNQDTDPNDTYLLERTNPDGSVTTLPLNYAQGYTLPYEPYYDQGLTKSTRYGYQVIAVDSDGNESDASPIVYATTWGAAQPTGLTVANGTDGGIALTWDDGRTGTNGNPNITGWDVLRATVLPDGSQTAFTSLLDGEEVVAPTYTDGTVVPLTTYVYEVVAVEHIGEESEPAVSQSIQVAAAPTGPAAPTNLATGYAGDYEGTYRVGLHWDATFADSLLGYDVYRGTTPDFVTDSTTLIGSSNDTGYTDDLTTPGTYYYVVKAVSATPSGEELSSPSSNEASVDTDDQTTAPAAPSGLAAPTVSNDEVQLVWTDNSVNEAGFEVRRKLDGTPDSDYQLVGRSTQDDAEFPDTTVDPGQDYDYEVLSYNFGPNSSVVYSTPDVLLDVQTPSIGPAPAAPTNLSEDASQTTWSQIALTWTAPDRSDDVVGYYVYRQQSDGTWLRLTDDPVQQTSYVDSNLTPGSYSYYITAVTGGYTQSAPLQGSFATATPAADQPPVAEITAPAAFTGINVNFSQDTTSDGRIQTLTPVQIIVADPNGYSVSWTLQLVPEGQADGGTAVNQPITLASGSAPVGSISDTTGQTVYVLDPTMYANGNYQLVLTATDQPTSGSPGQTITTTEVSLYSQTKLGNLNLPVTDLSFTAPNGQSLSVQRVYNSQNANTPGDFGNGWTLQLANTQVSTTAQYNQDYGTVAFAPGDVVYVTLPDGEQHAFQFFPVPTNYTNEYPDPYSTFYAGATYWIQFVCVDGSGDTLSVPGDIHDANGTDRLELQYDQGGNVFYGPDIDGDGGQYGYNPASPQFGDQYTLTTADGTVYTINAASGQLQSTEDSNGNVVTYSPNSISTDGYSLNVTRDGGTGQVIKIELDDPNGNALEHVSYTYATPQNSGELQTVTSPLNGYTEYGYDTDAGMGTYLTQVTSSVNGSMVNTLTATYNSLGQLTSLTDPYGQTATTDITSSDGSGGSQTVTEPGGGSAGTQNIYDAWGNVARSIQTVTDSSGNILGYEVTVHDFNYASAQLSDEVSDIFSSSPDYSKQAGDTEQNALLSEIDYAPFFISGLDSAGDRYSQAPTTATSETDYYFLQDAATPADIGQVAAQKQFLGDGSVQTTSYSDYTDDKPGKVVVTVSRGSSSQVTSSTDNYYDSAGNLIYSFDALGQGTEYDYTENTPGLPDGLLLATWQVTDEAALADGGTPTRLSGTPTTLNTYYTSDDVADGVVGAFAGKLETSTNAAGQLTFYAYDPMGDLVDEYTLKPNPTYTSSNGQSQYLWVGTSTTYDSAGRPQNTYQGEFEATGDVMDLNYSDGDPSSIADTAYPGFNPDYNGNGQPLPTGSTSYNSNGTVAATSDEYGNTTQYTYDANGNQIKTQNPDGTMVLTVYDAMGRVTWQTDAFSYQQPASTIMATHTVYNSQGQVIETDRYEGTDIEMTQNPLWQVQTTYVASTGTLISSTFTIYDNQGQVVESDSASGLRTGTIYYPDGQVQYTGPLNATAPADWYSLTNPLSYFSSYTTSLYNQFDTSTGNPWSGMMYNETIDADGNWTDTYQDVLGRTIFTVYEDGSFTQTLYSVNGQPVTSSSPYAPSDLAPPAGLTIPAGGSETVSIAQRDVGDPSVATYSIYDASGNLVDVYQPPVMDANPNSPTYNTMVAPEWQYTYDQSGDELSQTDPMGNVTSWTYDERGNELTHTLPGGQIESWTYDQFNRVVTQTDMDGNTTWDVYANTPQLFGQQGNDPSRLLAVYYYTGSFTPPATSEGIRPYQTDWTERTVYVYDDGTTDPSTGYNLPSNEQLDLGRVAQVQQWTNEDGTAVETDFTDTQYDPATGQPSSITSNEGTINYVYDSATGNKVRMWTGTDPNNAQDDTAYAYNAQGELTDVYTLVLDDTRYATYTGINPATHNPMFTGTPLDVHYTYDAAGNLIAESQPDDTTTTYTYDDESRLTGESVENTSTNEPVFAESYTYYDDGLRSGVTDTRYNAEGTVFSQTQTSWAYDNDGRLRNETLTDLAGGSNAPAAYSDAFKFDLDGNRVEEDETGSQNSAITYTYNSDNEMLTETGTGDDPYQVTYGYDDAGNLISQVRTGTNAETDTYTWTLQGQMATATVNGVTTSYTYDSNGVRTSETTAGVTTYYLNDPNNPTGYSKAVEEWTSSDGNRQDATISRSYVLGLQVEMQADSTNGVLVLMHDGHGSTRAVLSTNGSIVEQYNYDAYGDLLASAGAQSNAAAALTDWLFAGDGEYDAESDFTYQLARYRDGFRWTSMDPTVFEAGEIEDANVYVYASGNPIDVNDSSGDWSMTFGSAVNNWLSTQFELPGGGAVPGSLRFGNRWVSTILKQTVGYRGIPIPSRPDAVEVYKTPGGSTNGDIYEFKPGPITLLWNSASLVSAAVNAVSQIGSYISLLGIAPQINWQPGSLLWPGIKAWPTFSDPQQPPGTTLITFNLYPVEPGVIFYDFLPTQQATQLALDAAASLAGAELIYQVGVMMGPYIGAIGGAVANAINSLAIGVLEMI